MNVERGIIPRPATERYPEGEARWTPGDRQRVYAGPGSEAIASMAAARLALATGQDWPVVDDPRGAFLRLELEDVGVATGYGAEGYGLTVGSDGAWCRASAPAGLFYALQSLRQLLPSAAESPGGLSAGFSLPFATIVDGPRFAWRGFMLDEARHFHGVETVKALLDLMALHKLNVFHWHLNDDQGWRLESRRYPELTRVGSRRRDTVVGGTGSTALAGEPYEGCYTQAQAREVVEYAAERYITVVPEFELPGHASAALAAYPGLGCTGGPYQVEIGPGIFKDIYCAGKDEVLAFVDGILDELCDIFPSPYIHLGGDEAPKDRWRACPDCQARIRSEGLAGEEALQTWLFNRAAERLAAKGRRAIGWNEALGPALRPDAVAQFWMGDKSAMASHLRSGRSFIMSDFWRAYLDYDYCLHPLKKVYAYEPVPAGLPGSSVLGVEAPLWTEWVRDRARLDWQAFPRLLASAETAWTREDKKAYGHFESRLLGHLPRLDALGVRYAAQAEWNPSLLTRARRNLRFLSRMAAARRRNSA